MLFTTPSLIFSTVSSNTRFINGSKPRRTPATCRLAFNFTVIKNGIHNNKQHHFGNIEPSLSYIVISCPGI